MPKKALTARKQPQLLKAIQNKSRDHFEELLQRLIAAEPTQAEVQKWAKERPSEYYKAMKTVSTLAGYKDGSDVTNNTLIQISSMSDMALEAELMKLSPVIRQLVEKDITPE